MGDGDGSLGDNGTMVVLVIDKVDGAAGNFSTGIDDSLMDFRAIEFFS